jgi:GalNAc-alpha-(1->4)-GalNAc-alpha-(1->3)-diNAcBac-PP-undecaprenol alpha-1,4-N-acetyl-D-galactosaminyltransferase
VSQPAQLLRSVADSALPRRIVIVVGSMNAGGAERVAATMANAWVERGREVWLVSTYLGPRVIGYGLDPRVSLLCLSEAITHRSTLRWAAPLRKIPALRRLVSAIAPDVVVSFLTNVNVLVIAALARSGIPLIVSERVDLAADVELPWLLWLARALLYPFADALVVQTATVALRYRARLRGVPRIAIIGNPLPGELSTSGARARQDGTGGCVVAMGRLTAQKGFAGLIEAFHRALGENGLWRLQIWGDGPLRPDLQRLIDELHLADRVQLCGVTSEPWSVLAAAQIFALSSKYEGFPNAMLEAMAVGLPCVAFDCPSGPRELADGGDAAIIVKPGDVDMLAKALRDLAGDREGRCQLGARAAVFVRRAFSEASVMDAWDTLINEVIVRRKSRTPSAIASALRFRRRV